MSTRGGVKRVLNDSDVARLLLPCNGGWILHAALSSPSIYTDPTLWRCWNTRLKMAGSRVLSNNEQGKALSCKTWKWIQLTVVVTGMGLESTQIKTGVRSSAAAI